VKRYMKFSFSLAALSLISIAGDGSARIQGSGGSAQAAAAADKVRDARIAYLKKQAIPISSIDANNVDFADLEPLRKAIGDRRIVMLGEITHGDGATFAAKVRLIKFLHERMGFDVLAFESGFYDMRRAWSELRSGKDPLAAVSAAAFVDWSASLQVRPLWSYIAERLKTGHPLELAGFDMQFTGSASNDHLLNDLSDYLSKSGLPPDAAAAVSRVKDTLALVLGDPNFMWSGSEFKKIGAKDRASALAAHRALGEALGSLGVSDDAGRAERDFWAQFMRSSAAFLEQSWRVEPEKLENETLNWAINLRDRQMGDNFAWLAKHAFPARKIIVWAATSHIIRHRNLVPDARDPNILMGDWIEKSTGPEVYILGFTAYQGWWGTVDMAAPTEVAPAAPNSLEELLFSAGFEYALVDFRDLGTDGAWLRGPLSSRPLSYKPMTTDWTRVMDGMVFIKEMFPSTRASLFRLKNENPFD
jgi:erythromycin esterase